MHCGQVREWILPRSNFLPVLNVIPLAAWTIVDFPWYYYEFFFYPKNNLLAPAGIERLTCCLPARRLPPCTMTPHRGSAARSPVHLTARTSVYRIQLTFLVYHYYRLQFATDRLWVATVVIIWPISSAYRCICIIFVQSWPDISALHSPGGSAYNQCRQNGGWCAESKVLQWRYSEQPVLVSRA